MTDDRPGPAPDVVVCPDGPILVRGSVLVRGPGGEEQWTTRAVSAVCRCGKSANPPWCDGTHKLLTTR